MADLQDSASPHPQPLPSRRAFGMVAGGGAAWLLAVGLTRRDSLFSADFPTLKAAMIAWMWRGGTLVITEDHTEVEPFAAIDGALLPNKVYRLETRGARTITYDGPAVPVFWRLHSGGPSDLELDGDLTLDCRNRAGVGLLVDRPQPTGRGACSITGLKVLNCKMRAGAVSAYGASGLSVLGGFTRVRLSNVRVRDISREAGTGQTGSFGTSGITIFGSATSTANAQAIVIEDCSLENIGSDDRPDSSRYTDMDGLLVFQYRQPRDQVQAPIIRNIEARNCNGRAIKRYSTAFGGVTEGFRIWQDGPPRREGFHAVAHQDGSGLIRNGEIYLSGAANDQPGVPIWMSLGSALDNSGGRAENISIFDTTGVPLGAVVSVYKNTPDNFRREFHFAGIRHTGKAEQFMMLGALGAHANTKVTLSDIDVEVLSAIALTDDPVNRIRIEARNVRNRGRSVPVVRALNGSARALDSGVWQGDDRTSGFGSGS